MTDITNKIREAVLAKNPEKKLVEIAIQLSSKNQSRKEIYEIFLKFHNDFCYTEEWQEIEEQHGDHPVDLILDRLSGWCKSDLELLP